MTATIRRPLYIDCAGEIIRSLSPRALGTVWLLGRSAAETQIDIADRLSCTPPAVSKHLTALSELAVALVEKSGSRYTVTSAGYAVLDVTNELLGAYGRPLSSIDWSSATDRGAVESALEPLSTTRSSRLFTVLTAITSLGSFEPTSSGGGEVVLSRSTVIHEAMSIRSGTGISRRTVRRQLTALEESESIRLSDDQITVTTKGARQLWLFEDIRQVVDLHGPDERSHQSASEPTSGPDERTIVSFSGRSDDARIEPTLYADGDPVFAIPATLTVDELIDAASRLSRKYDGDQQLTREWTTVESHQ